jgi:hypothetical protein
MAKAPDAGQLGSAKAAAVQLLLSPTETFRGLTGLAASTRPRHNVVGVGIGRKVSNGKVTAPRAIRIYVQRKVAEKLMPREFVIPKKIEGVPTDVVESGRFVALAVPVAQRRTRPMKGGCSVGFQFSGPNAGFVMAGTLGALVKDAVGKRYILSNNHVIAHENALALGSPIFQPGLLDNGNPTKDHVAVLSRFLEIKPAPTQNKVDAAIAALDKASLGKAVILPKVGKLAGPAPIPAVEGMKVHKHGRTTSYTTGSVIDVAADVKIDYDFGEALFIDQIVIVGDKGSFSASGDSGSLIVDRASKRATGLLFAGSATHTIANHMSDVANGLAITLM